MKTNANRTPASESNPDNRQNTPDTSYPGYPHYPSKEDITSREADMDKVRFNENAGSSSRLSTSRDEADLRSDEANDNAMRPIGQAGNAANAESEEQDFRNDSDGDIDADNDADVTAEERILLDNAERGIDDSDDAQAPLRAQLDETDEDGTPLNEASGREGFLGDDLVVPGSEMDDANENIGEEDEENNYYSLGSDDNDTTDNANEGSINKI